MLIPANWTLKRGRVGQMRTPLNRRFNYPLRHFSKLGTMFLLYDE